MTDVLRDLRYFADHLCGEHDIGAVTLQVCDRSTSEHRVVQILNLKVPDDAPHTYQAKHIFAQDPFTDVELNEAADIAYSDAPIRPDDARIVGQRARCGTYWGFIDQFDLLVEGVSTRRMRRGVYTIAGFLRDRRRSYANPLPVEMLERASGVLHNMMAAELLRGTVQHNGGLLAFQRLLDLTTEAPAPSPADVLSTREWEVAVLVARGNQTKQVAFQLGLSEHTVENHLRRIYAKLGIHSRARLAHVMS